MSTKQVQTFAGLEFEFQFYDDTCMQERGSILTTVQNHFHPSYIAGLVAATYGRPNIKQAVLDALSPFQMMSKSWMSSLVAYAIQQVANEEYDGHYPDFNLRYHGSWFGQSAHLDNQHVDGPQVESMTLIDLDENAMDVARHMSVDKCAGLGNNVAYVVGDALDYPFASEERNVVIWNGVEHFPKGSVQKFIAQAPRGTLFCLQGTDMPAPDHINPVIEISDLYDPEAEMRNDHLLYFGGLMTCSFARRFAVAVYKR